MSKPTSLAELKANAAGMAARLKIMSHPERLDHPFTVRNLRYRTRLKPGTCPDPWPTLDLTRIGLRNRR